jgi:hypothetical protein
MLQTIRHLTDSDVVFAFRYRMIIGQDSPPITGYDQDSWCRQLGYNEADLEQSFELLRVLRRDNLRMLRTLTPQERRRGGMHSERGFEDIERLMRLHAAHDIVHSRQIARIRAAVAGEG